MHYSFRFWGFRLDNLETLKVLAYFFRDSKVFRLIILETLTLLAYSFRDSKCFALLI